MKFQKRNRQIIGSILNSSVLPALHYKTFVPLYCWYGQEFIPVYVDSSFTFIKLYLNFIIINFITA
jgi:hypothetical protein